MVEASLEHLDIAILTTKRSVAYLCKVEPQVTRPAPRPSELERRELINKAELALLVLRISNR